MTTIRHAIEKAIVEKTVTDLLKAGYYISVNDGEETTLKKSKSIAAILSALFTTDEDCLLLHIKGTEAKEWLKMGFVSFVYGNDGHDVMSDYSTALENDLKGANQFADDIEQGNIKIIPLTA